MSKILNRPMFRGGGKVSSYGNGIATGLADGGMPDKRGLVDGPGGYAGLDTKSGFRNSPAYKFGSAGLDAIGKVALDPLNYVANPVANAFNQGIVNPLAGLFGYGDLMKRVETPYDNKYLFGGEKFGESREYETDSGAIPKAILEAEKDTDKLTDSERRLEMENNELKKLLDSFGGSSKEDTEDEALAAIEKKQKLLEKVMGGGKSARIADASDMALNFASKALGEEATVKSSFADFFADESKRPSRSQKVKDAAANAAIQSYLTEQLSEKDFNKQMRMIMGKQEILNKSNNPENMDWNKRRSYYQTIGKDRNRDVDSVLKSSLQDEPGNNQVIFTEKTDFIKDPTLASEMEDGFYVVTTKNGKRVFQIIEGILTDRSSDFPI